MYILMFIIGAFCGMFCVGIVMSSSRVKDMQNAYEKGRADERGRILESVEKKFGGESNG